MMLLDSMSNVMDRSAAADAVFSRGPQLPSVEEVFHQHAPRVYRLARRLMGHDADAEDVTQEVLLQVVRKLDTFRGEADLGTWLHRVTVNAVLAHRRKQARRRERQVDTPLTRMEDGAFREAPEQAVLDQETQEMVEQALAGLPEMYRDVHVLSDVERRSNAEIADLLGLSLPAVKSRLHRARLMMREALASYFQAVSTRFV
jgi:RNA polymerase sigma-70 factor (ECF subfamily)